MEETRQRIVDGALSLHLEKGIAATSIKDIASRAKVGVGTVYFHFATYEEVVRACGVRVNIITRPPTPDVFEGVETLTNRVERLVHELFAFYERYHWFDRLRCERDKLGFVGQAVTRREAAIVALVREALRPVAHEEPIVQTVVALTDFTVHKSLIASGMSTSDAAKQVTIVLMAWLTTATQSRDT